jgi:hypothetical protein
VPPEVLEAAARLHDADARAMLPSVLRQQSDQWSSTHRRDTDTTDAR